MDDQKPGKSSVLQIILALSGFFLIAVGLFSWTTGFLLVEGEFPLVPVVLLAGGFLDLFLAWVVFRAPGD